MIGINNGGYVLIFNNKTYSSDYSILTSEGLVNRNTIKYIFVKNLKNSFRLHVEIVGTEKPFTALMGKCLIGNKL